MHDIFCAKGIFSWPVETLFLLVLVKKKCKFRTKVWSPLGVLCAWYFHAKGIFSWPVETLGLLVSVKMHNFLPPSGMLCAGHLLAKGIISWSVVILDLLVSVRNVQIPISTGCVVCNCKTFPCKRYHQLIWGNFRSVGFNPKCTNSCPVWVCCVHGISMQKVISVCCVQDISLWKLSSVELREL